ncbi:MAG TPA: SCO family protein [Candidatus Bathyarchaeia archaeon]|nr:SCO family protein [Candidatus Bathyarchaeia archaeon]
MNRYSTSLILALLFVGSATHTSRAAETAAEGGQIHVARGEVRELAPDRRKAVIRHETITNYMPAMTMEFNIRDTNELAGVAPGDIVTFRLTATEDDHWIDHIAKVAPATSHPLPGPTKRAARGKPAELKPGDLLPDCELLAEDGRRVRLSDFRGKALALTFFFTRCPLPDYCPRMGKNFAQARAAVLATANAPTNWQFLSISFDPEFDQPAVLASYANLYRGGNADRWVFAGAPTNVLAELAPQLDLMVNREAGGNISHNLRTVVLDGEGRIRRQFDGNQWTAEELAQEMVRASKTAGKVAGQRP